MFNGLAKLNGVNNRNKLRLIKKNLNWLIFELYSYIYMNIIQILININIFNIYIMRNTIMKDNFKKYIEK